MKKIPSIVYVNTEDLHYGPEYDNLDDVLSAYLSETYGFCHYEFNYAEDLMSGDIKIFNIKRDTSE